VTDITPEMEALMDKALGMCGFSFTCSMIPDTLDDSGTAEYRAAIQRGSTQLWGTYILAHEPAMWEIVQGLVWSAVRVSQGQSFLEYAASQDFDECGVSYPLDIEIWTGLQDLGLNHESLAPLVNLFDTIQGVEGG